MVLDAAALRSFSFIVDGLRRPQLTYPGSIRIQFCIFHHKLGRFEQLHTLLLLVHAMAAFPAGGLLLHATGNAK
jgi:hypothetical protein